MEETKVRSLKWNMVLNTIKGLMGILFPLITFPYVSRILGVDTIGRYNFAASVISYFVLFSGLGINTYAIREGARLRDKKAEFQQLANELFSINTVSTVLSYLLLVVFLLLVPKFQGYLDLLLILSLQIVFKTIGIEWIYSVYEDYMYITVRSIVFQLLSLVLMFLLVRTQRDVNLYAAITVVSSVGSNVLNYVHARRYCKVRLTWRMDLRKHLKPILVLFAMSAMVTVYVSSDITVLGFFCDDATVGIYSVSSKVYSIIKTVLSSILVVSIPRLSAILGKNDQEEFGIVAREIYGILLTFLFPVVTGIFVLRKQIVLVVAGVDYLPATSSLFLLGIALICCFGAYFWGQCILVPMKYENTVFKITAISAGINFVLNLLLIPVWKENAAAFTTIIAEGLAFLFSWYKGRKLVRIKGMGKLLVKILVGCAGIVGFTVLLSYMCRNYLMYTVLAVIGSVIIYFLIEILMRNNWICDMFLDRLKT